MEQVMSVVRMTFCWRRKLNDESEADNRINRYVHRDRRFGVGVMAVC